MPKLVRAKIKAIRHVSNPGRVCDVSVPKNHNLFVKHPGSASAICAHNCNVKFDLHQILTLCGIRWYNHAIYDVQAGAFNLDEMQQGRYVIGYARKTETWSLDRLCLEAGMSHYQHSEIGKGDRARLATVPLELVAKYGALDVVLPLRLMKMQIALARWRMEHMHGRPYAQFVTAVVQVDGAKIEQFCFHPDTMVATEAGPRCISQLVKDIDRPRVLSYNHDTQEAELQRITAVSEHAPDEEMVEIVHETGKLRVTASHELWCVNRGCYVRAKDFKPEDELLDETTSTDRQEV